MYISKKENNIHDEIMHISDNQTTNINTLCSNSNTNPPSDVPPKTISLEQYKEEILNSEFEEYKLNRNGNSSPIRENRQKQRKQNSHNEKRSTKLNKKYKITSKE